MFVMVLQVLFAILLAALGIAQAQMSFPDITQAAAAIDRVFGTIDRTPTRDATDSAGAAAQPASTLAPMSVEIESGFQMWDMVSVAL